MYNSIQLAFKYLNYYFTAANGKGHGIHSPFVFDFITKILNDKIQYPAYDKVEKLRAALLNDQNELVVADLGAGSGSERSDRRKVASITRNAAKPKKYGQLLFRVARYYKPAIMLELGTSLGITSSYLSLAVPEAKLVTMEGASSVAATALENFKALQLENIQVVEGNFDDMLSPVVDSIAPVDLAFVDGNHRKEPTLRYFNTLLSRVHDNSIIIFDDIHWSTGMEEAWQTIKNNASVKCSIDLFFIGLIFFREEFREKQHFTIRF